MLLHVCAKMLRRKEVDILKLNDGLGQLRCTSQKQLLKKAHIRA